jgi:hypothetical protein
MLEGAFSTLTVAEAEPLTLAPSSSTPDARTVLVWTYPALPLTSAVKVQLYVPPG